MDRALTSAVRIVYFFLHLDIISEKYKTFQKLIDIIFMFHDRIY